MKNKKNLTIAITSIVLVMLILLGLTYAYYRTRVLRNEKEKSVGVMTKYLKLVYRDGSPDISIPELEPSDRVYEKVFTVTNEGDDTVSYRVFLIDVVNTLERKDDVKYTLSCTTNGDLPCGEVDGEKTFPSKKTEISTASIEPNKTHTYTFSFTYKDTGTDQSVDMGKLLGAKIQIYGDEITFEEGTLAAAILNNAHENTNGTVFLETPRTKVAEEISAIYLDKGETSATAKKSYLRKPFDEIYMILEDGDWGQPTSCDQLIGYYFSPYYEFSTINEFEYSNGFVNVPYISGCENGVPYYYVDGDSTLSIAEDDYGKSYYFRGNVEDNYVTFADMCWRVVRIAGDGSIKLILEDSNQSCSSSMDGVWALPTTYGYKGNYGREVKEGDRYNKYIMNYLEPKDYTENSMVKAFYDFQISLNNKIRNIYSGKTLETMLKSGDWCLGDKAYTSDSYFSYEATFTPLEKYDYNNEMFYDSYVRLSGKNKDGYNPTFKCNGTVLKEFADVNGVTAKSPMYVGAITADEFVYAGGKEGEMHGGNRDYYLANNYFKYAWESEESVHAFWTFSPVYYSGGDNVYIIEETGFLFPESVLNGHSDDELIVGLRPVISLIEGITITRGDGTIDNPYVIG